MNQLFKTKESKIALYKRIVDVIQTTVSKAGFQVSSDAERKHVKKHIKKLFKSTLFEVSETDPFRIISMLEEAADRALKISKGEIKTDDELLVILRERIFEELCANAMKDAPEEIAKFLSEKASEEIFEKMKKYCYSSEGDQYLKKLEETIENVTIKINGSYGDSDR